MLPRAMKYSMFTRSPSCRRVSPGGKWTVFNLVDNSLRQPVDRRPYYVCTYVMLDITDIIVFKPTARNLSDACEVTSIATLASSPPVIAVRYSIFSQVRISRSSGQGQGHRSKKQRVCVSCSGCNFWMSWPTNFISGTDTATYYQSQCRVLRATGQEVFRSPFRLLRNLCRTQNCCHSVGVLQGPLRSTAQAPRWPLHQWPSVKFAIG